MMYYGIEAIQMDDNIFSKRKLTIDSYMTFLYVYKGTFMLQVNVNENILIYEMILVSLRVVLSYVRKQHYIHENVPMRQKVFITL